MFEAARDGDTSACPCLLPKPHIGGGLTPPVSPTVEANGLGLARGGDPTTCIGDPTPNFVIPGAATVEVNGRPAARRTALTFHQGPAGERGELLHGSANVLIGGPSAGIGLGQVGSGTAMCEAVKAGRSKPGKAHQSYSNCGIEATRQIIQQATGSTITEDELFDEALREGDCTRETGKPTEAENRYRSGGTTNANREAIAARHGVSLHHQAQTMDNIAQAVAEGRGVISSNLAKTLWDSPQGGAHAVVVTGMEFDAEGRCTVIYNDTSGQCGARVDASRFERSLLPGCQLDVTDAPIYP